MNIKGNSVFYFLAAILILLLTASVLGLIFLHLPLTPTITDVYVAIDFASFENGAVYEDFVALAEEMVFVKNPKGDVFLERISRSVDGVALDFEASERRLDYKRLDWQEEDIRECEVVCIRFRFDSEEKECFCLYDYESFDEYVVRDGNLYEISGLYAEKYVGIVERPEYERLVKSSDSASYNDDWYDVGSFRYRRHFFTTQYPETAIFSGFQNKTNISIESDEQVLELALSEMDYPNTNISGFYYDKLSGYYLVRLTKNHPRHLPGDPWTHLFVTGGTDVIIDGNGITKEIVPNYAEYLFH